MTAGLPVMKNVLTPLAQSVFNPLGLTTAASATDAVIQKKIYGLGTTALIISNKEMEDIMKIVKSLDKSGLIIKGTSETIKNESKKQKARFIPTSLETFPASILGNVYSRKRSD